ncbi:MAG: hypothetical protein K9I26_08235 [Flavobacterium sp.]|nr:hypothetical protein [Flavobacterium sp.]
MIIHLKNGIDQLLFGMKQKDVIALYGHPTQNYTDEDDNVIFTYHHLKVRLTFYQDEAFRLGYIIASSQDLFLFDHQIIGKKTTDVINDLAVKGITKFTQESFDTIENYFNESNWMTLQTEFGEVVKVEIGAIINDKDEFDWKFKA